MVFPMPHAAHGFLHLTPLKSSRGAITERLGVTSLVWRESVGMVN